MLICLQKLYNAIVAFLFSRGCLVCDKRLNNKDLLCERCIVLIDTALIRVDGRCPKCSRPSRKSELCDCCHSRKELYLFDSVEALFLYQEELRRLLIKFKLHSYLHLGELWATLIYTKAKNYIDMGYVIVPAPSNTKHSSFSAINYYLHKQGIKIHYCLYKKRGVAQKNLKGKERLIAIKGRIYSKGVVPMKVLLIDDIFTTGATVSECTKILKEGGSQEVRAIVIAIAPTG